MYIYIYSEESQNTRAHADTHNILCACTSPELHTYKYGDISSKTVVILPYFVHMHVSFQAKEVDAPKRARASVFHNTAGTTLVEHEARFDLGSTAVLRNSREIKICLNAELPTH